MGLNVEIEIRGDGVTQALLDAINVRIAEFADTRFDDVVYNTFVPYDDWRSGAYFTSLWRFWGPGYERGSWLNISSVLMVASQQIDMTRQALFYGNDCRDPETFNQVTAEFMREMWAHYSGAEWDAYHR